MPRKQLSELIERATAERVRQADLPGSECDAKNTPGDWVAMITHYGSAEVRRNGVVPSASDFEDTLVKTIAVALAALTHIDDMKARGELID